MIKFNEKYNREGFIYFLRDFLPADFQEEEKDIILEKNKFKKITNVKELGFCKSLDLTILEIDHNSENDPRVTIATEAFKVLAQWWVHKALVIFRNKDSENYRFSYLTISLDLNDKNKAIKKYSNARRYSFYLGPGAKTKTPELQLIKNGRLKDANDLFSRFSLEVVNKQFYFEVAKYFDELVSDETQNLSLPSQVNVTVRKSFAVRLIGRIMFCWFLKQKKSDCGQLVPDELLSSRVVADNYYHNILERLFFEVLNTNIDDRGIRNEFYDKVPYLNGGLFSPQSEDYYELDRSIGVSKYINTLKINDKWFKGFFELLETYNFTIDENTVFDQELSVDPEMLGRIFENLLAEINPETGSSERKRTGSFYTPRQIVEYMVDQSLIEYLKTKTEIDDKKLSALVSYDEKDDLEFPLLDSEKEKIVDAIDSLKILDPACGSGAFPIGMLQKLVYILQAVDESGILWRKKKLENVPELYRRKIEEVFDSQDKNYIRKLEVIKNSIFGIDIQPIAVEVSRLRCFLTLVVDDKIDDSRKNRGIDPLPNLDFKFVCANTLIPAPDQEFEAIADSVFRDPFQEKFASAVDRYFSSAGVNKINAGNEIHKLIDEKVKAKFKYLDSLVSYGGDRKMEEARAKINKKQIERHSRILTLWGSYKNIFENKPVDFFEIKYFFPSVKDGFDIVIGNPPYVEHKKLKHISTVLKDSYLTYSGTADLYVYFYENGIKNLKENGNLVYITSNKFFRTSYGENLRKYFMTFKINEVIDFTDVYAFEALVASCIFSISKSKVIDNKIKIAFADDTLTNFSGISAFVEQNKFFLKQITLSEKIWQLENETKLALKKKIESGSIPIKDTEVINIYRGVTTGYNPAFIIDEVKRNELMKEDKANKAIIKPLLQGRNIRKWVYNKTYDYLIFTRKGIDIKEYPLIKKHLSNFKKELEPGVGRKAGSYNWFEIQDNTAYYREFEKEKIIWGLTSDKWTFAYDNENNFLPSNGYILTSTKIPVKYLLALLNSKLMEFYFGYIGIMTAGGAYTLKYETVVDFPIKNISSSEQEPFIEIVNKVLAIKKQDKNADIKNLESQIDHLVYKLYNLTPEEIEVIENSSKK